MGRTERAPANGCYINSMPVNSHLRKYWVITRTDGTISLVYNLRKWCEANDYDVQRLYMLNRLKIRKYKDITQVQSLTQHEYNAFTNSNQQGDRQGFVYDLGALDFLVERE